MLSSTVDNKANSYQALVESRVDSPGAAQADHGIMDLQQTGRNDLKNANSLATVARHEERKRFGPLSVTTY